MKKFLTIVGMAVSLAAPALAADGNPPPSLTASGEATEYAVPDMATVTLGVVSEARSAREALDANSAAIAKVIEAIKAAGIAEKDIGTTGFNVSPVWSNPQPKTDGTVEAPHITGYQVSNQVAVVIRDLEKTGMVLDASVTAGANQAAQIDFGLADRKPVEDKALGNAIADANRKAKLMAEAAGVKLVRILSVTAGGNGPGPYPAPMAFRAEAKAVPVMAGERSIAASATVTWEIGE
jgi:uncharacterized protein YggE